MKNISPVQLMLGFATLLAILVLVNAPLVMFIWWLTHH